MDIGSIILFVKNMRTVTAFYRDVLGLHPDEEQPFPPHRFFRFNTGQCKLCLHSASKPNGGRQKVVFHVGNVKAVHDALKTKGLRLRPLKDLEDGLACFDISDPESNKIQFWGNY
jgi:catechol 2,3-dioxygenase-like lactoylglutathione lyase family enzyme